MYTSTILYRNKITIFSVLISFLMFGCSTVQNVEKQEETPNNKELKTFIDSGTGKDLETAKTSPTDIIKTAKTYLGTPHCMGGHTKKCTDCSGFVMAVFAEHGISLPHNSQEQARFGKPIYDKSKLQTGDLVFFINTYKTNNYITHAGIYLGNNEFIHASSSNGVTITSLDNNWWQDKFVFGTRVF